MPPFPFDPKQLKQEYEKMTPEQKKDFDAQMFYLCFGITIVCGYIALIIRCFFWH